MSNQPDRDLLDDLIIWGLRQMGTIDDDATAGPGPTCPVGVLATGVPLTEDEQDHVEQCPFCSRFAPAGPHQYTARDGAPVMNLGARSTPSAVAALDLGEDTDRQRASALERTIPDEGTNQRGDGGAMRLRAVAADRQSGDRLEFYPSAHDDGDRLDLELPGRTPKARLFIAVCEPGDLIKVTISIDGEPRFSTTVLMGVSHWADFEIDQPIGSRKGDSNPRLTWNVEHVERPAT